jgi:hypothetical protein
VPVIVATRHPGFPHNCAGLSTLDAAVVPAADGDMERPLRPYEEGGWLMDGNTFNSYKAARTTLLREDAGADSVFDALSMLRTDMKIELGVREPSERDVPSAPSEERGFRR